MANLTRTIPKRLDLPRSLNSQEDIIPYIHNLVESLNRQNSRISDALQGPVFTNVPFSASPYTIVLSTNTAFVGANANATTDFIANLPPALGTQLSIIVKKLDSNAHNIVVTASGTDTIDGSATYSLTTQYQFVRLIDSSQGVWLIY